MKKTKKEENTLTLGKVWDADVVLNRLSRVPLPTKTSYRIMKLVNKVRSECVFINTKRVELLKKHEIKILDNGNPDLKDVSKEKIDSLNKEFNDLNNVKSDLEFQPLTLDMLESTTLSASDILALGEFLVEEGK